MATPDTVARAVIRHRLDASPALEIQLGIAPMMDVPAHQVLQGDLKRLASPWERLVATESIVNAIPDEPGLYMFVWRPSIALAMADRSESSFQQVLYIGHAGGAGELGNTLRNRYRDYKKHLRGNPEDLWTREPPTNRGDRLTHYLALHPLEYWFATVDDRSMIKNLESRLIHLYNPPINIQGGPTLRGRLSSIPKPALRS
ncbi:GIY-YIG nuclease family protein [Kitasatospora xanthocidica]|uniref:GIY-YIG nuclease family protein n=1 Tax=Kitasatospora xanthocidica TaxID=83382 RepID=A0A372ZWT7_9ACTN|nr:GIY-YIG nuclease family protein [Kitasatospora xanthocidica]RGD60303.1 GIY-YIG nuclease family protein [Kitasatospora xanthocidica]